MPVLTYSSQIHRRKRPAQEKYPARGISVSKSITFGSSLSVRLTVGSVRIFFFGSKSSPDMAFRLIYIKHMSGLLRQGGINLHQSVCDILMYRALGHAECLGGLTHRGIGFDDIVGNVDCPLLDVILQKKTP